MAASFIASASAGNFPNTTTVTPTLGAAAVAGDLLVGVCFMVNNGNVTTPPAGYTLVRAQAGPSGRNLEMYYKVAAGGETSATFVSTNGSYITAHLFQFRGLTGTPVLNADAGATGGQSGSFASGSVTPTAGVEAIIVNAACCDPHYGPSAPSGYSNQLQNLNGTPRVGGNTASRIEATTSGSYGGTWTGAGGETWWSGVTAAFVGGAGAGSGARAVLQGMIG